MTDILANAKQALFDHMAQEHNVTLLASEMQDIVTLCERIARAQLLTQQEPDTQQKLDKAREALLKLQTKLTDLHEGEGEISLMGRCLDASLIVQQALKDTE